jgi:hypothetical protein
VLLPTPGEVARGPAAAEQAGGYRGGGSGRQWSGGGRPGTFPQPDVVAMDGSHAADGRRRGCPADPTRHASDARSADSRCSMPDSAERIHRAGVQQHMNSKPPTPRVARRHPGEVMTQWPPALSVGLQGGHKRAFWGPSAREVARYGFSLDSGGCESCGCALPAPPDHSEARRTVSCPCH